MVYGTIGKELLTEYFVLYVKGKKIDWHGFININNL